MTDTITNRHGDELKAGQHWLDHPSRNTRRTLRIDGFDNVGTAFAAAICTVVSAHDQNTGEITEPGRVVSIKIDSLHTTRSGRGYQRADTVGTRESASAEAT